MNNHTKEAILKLQLNGKSYQLLDSIHDALFSLDKDQKLTYVNNAALMFFNRKNTDELIGKNLWKELPGLVKTSFYKRFVDAMERNQPSQFEEFYAPLNRWFQLNIHPFSEGYVVYFTDITSLKTLEGHLKFQSNILENISDSVIVTDLNKKIIYWNESSSKLFGLSESEVLTQDIDTVLSSQDITPFESKLSSVHKGKDYIFQWQNTKSDGNKIAIESKITRLVNKKGQVIGLIYISKDISKNLQDREIIELRVLQQDVISKLGQLALSGENLVSLFSITNQVLCRALNVNYVKITELDEKDSTFVFRSGLGWNKNYVPNKTRFSSSHHSLSHSTLNSRKPLIVKDFSKDKRFKKNMMLQEHKIVSGMSIIIAGSVKPYGVLGVYSNKARNFTKYDVDFLQSVGNILAMAIERKKFEDTLRYHAILTSDIPDAIISTDLNFIIKSWNKGATSLYGWTESEAVGRKSSELIPTEFLDKMNDTRRWFKDLLTLGTWKGEVKQKTKNGDEIYVLAHQSIVKDVEMNSTGFVTVNRDITERANVIRSLRFLSESSQLLSLSLDLNKTVSSFSKHAVTEFSDWCVINLNTDGIKIQKITSSSKAKKELKTNISNADIKFLSDTYGSPRVLKTGKPEFYPIVDQNTINREVKSPHHRKLVKSLNVLSAMIVPIKDHTRTIGSISFANSENGRKFSESDFQVVQQLASRISLTLERIKLYQTVQKERERLNSLVTNVPGIVWESWGNPTSKNQKGIFVSEQSESLIGYKVENWIKNPTFWLSIIHSDDRESVIRTIRNYYNSGVGGTIKFRWIKKDKTEIWAEAHLYVLKDRTGKTIGMTGVFMDISERMLDEKRKDEFISMASHELKTPVTSLKVYSQLLAKQLRRESDKKFLDYISRMEGQVDKLTKLVKDLLDISRIQSGKLVFDMEHVNVNEIATHIIDNIQQLSNKHKIELKGSINGTIMGDKDRIGQVIINLLNNAIKYSQNADKINVELKQKNGMAIISVTDYGIGIAKEEHEKIFERFYQVGESERKTYPGLGIGLHISSEIARRHGGMITVESSLGKGSTFHFHLPMKKG